MLGGLRFANKTSHRRQCPRKNRSAQRQMPSGIPLESSSQGLFAESLISWVFSSTRKAIFDPATGCFTRRGDMLLVRLNGMGDGSRPTGQMRVGPNGSMHVPSRGTLGPRRSIRPSNFPEHLKLREASAPASTPAEPSRPLRTPSGGRAPVRLLEQPRTPPKSPVASPDALEPRRGPGRPLRARPSP